MKSFVNGFAIWLFGASALALIWPPSFLWLDMKRWVDPMLGIVMLGMGLTLTIEDFTRIGKRPWPVFLGVLLQFTLMPLAGYLAARWFYLDTPLAVGLILVACCPGGTASNVVSYIAKADVALSVTMTAVSTIAAVIATPMLTAWLVGSRVDIDPWTLILKTANVVLIPVLLGLLLRRYLPRFSQVLLPIAPAIAVVCLVLIVAGIVAVMQKTILESGVVIIAAVAVVHLFGAALGYLLGRIASSCETTGRTISIEVGMQNGGLGTSLANSGAFQQASFVALPCALSGLMSCLIGSLLAAFWSRRPVGQIDSGVATEIMVNDSKESDLDVRDSISWSPKSE